MTIANYSNFKGLLLPLDPRRVQEPFAFRGKNFIPAVNGIKSEFGADVILAQTERQDGMGDTVGATSINLPNDERTYFCTRKGIFEIAARDFRLVPRYELSNAPVSVHKWTAADVGGVVFFARKDVGLISFNPVTGLWREHADLYEDIIACAEIDGRLFLASGTVVAWSGIDLSAPPGQDAAAVAANPVFHSFITSTATGAGFQSLSIIGVNDRDDVITCLPYTQGIITYTKGGFLRSELISSGLVFRHRPVYSRNENPLNDFAVTQYTQEQHLWLSLRGFFVQDGTNPPQMWQPVTGEFIREKIPVLDPALFNRARLHYAPVEGWVCVSLDERDNAVGNFDICYVYVAVSDSWGSFNKAHTGWHTVQLEKGRVSTCYTTVKQNTLYQLKAQNVIRSYEEVDIHELSRIFLLPANISKYPLEYYLFMEDNTEKNAYLWKEEFQAEGFVFDVLFVLSIGWFLLEKPLAPITSFSYYGAFVIFKFFEFPELALDSEVSLGMFKLPHDASTGPDEVSRCEWFLIATSTQAQLRFDHLNFEINKAGAKESSPSYEWIKDSVTRSELPEDLVSDWNLPSSVDIIDDAQAALVQPIRAKVSIQSSLDLNYDRHGNTGQVYFIDRASSREGLVFETYSTGRYHSLHFACTEKEEAFYIHHLEIDLKATARFAASEIGARAE